MAKKAKKKKEAINKQLMKKDEPKLISSLKESPKPTFNANHQPVFNGMAIKESESLRLSHNQQNNSFVAKLKLALTGKRPMPVFIEFSFSSFDLKPDNIYLISVKDSNNSPIPIKFSQLPMIKKQLVSLFSSHLQK